MYVFTCKKTESVKTNTNITCYVVTGTQIPFKKNTQSIFYKLQQTCQNKVTLVF
jgi:hypothetical protein